MARAPRLPPKENKVGTTIVSRYDYSVNELGQRESVTTRVTSFPVLPSWVWGHDGFGQVTSADSRTNNGFDRAYQYDALGRRTKRTETIGGVTTDTWFFANGWNVELEHNGSDFTRRLSWGLDLSNTLQGAGGVGGLVMTEELPSGGGAPIPHFPTYDGNGNITAWINAGGSVIARERYDAFGNIVEQTGTAPSNYGFSTKPIEKLTGFLYYTYRYYDPATGRWPSRDPIEERGGINLYVFVRNGGLGVIDLLGLERTTITSDEPSVSGPPSFLNHPGIGAGSITQVQLNDLSRLVTELRQKKDSKGCKCFEVDYNPEASTTNQMFDSVKNYDDTHIIAHGGRDAPNRLTTINGLTGDRNYAVGIRNVAQRNGNCVSFYACNMDINGNRTQTGEPGNRRDVDWDTDADTTRTATLAALIANLTSKLNKEPCPEVESISVMSGQSD